MSETRQLSDILKRIELEYYESKIVPADGSVKPSDIYYEGNTDGEMGTLSIAGYVVRCFNPRLLFAKALSTFEDWDIELLEYTAGNWIMDGINTKGIGMGNGNVIGNTGFGYVKDNDGSWFEMPHFGSVVFGPGVQIGNNNNIDRGVIGDTVIGAGVKIDSLCHIAHGVTIGENTLVVAGSIIGGSARIGKNCYIGMGAKVLNKITVGDNVTIGAGAVVTRDVPDGETWVGVPARKLEKTSGL